MGTLSNQTSTSVTYTAPANADATVMVTATSVQDKNVMKSVTIMVTAPPSITTTQAQLTAAPATGGVAYTFTFTAKEGAAPLSWTATGLPAGLSMSSSGALLGTATVTGTFTINVKVTDSSMGSSGPQSQTTSFTLTVNKPAPPAITTTQGQVSAATVGTAYAFTFKATGTGTLTWSAGGTLPADGLSLNTATGVVSGTPTAPQTLGITLTVSDSFGQSSPATGFTITVNPAPLVITTTTLPGGTIGTAYSQNVAVTGGTTPYTWSNTGSLPAGLSLNTSTGAITGTPLPTAVTSSFTIKVTDSSTPQMSTTQNLSIAITLVITTTTLPNGAVNTAYPSTNVVAEGGTLPYAWSVGPGSLPLNLALNPSTGAISGTVAANATSQTFTVKVQDSSATKQTATQSLTIFIPLAIETASLPNGAIGTAYNQTVAAGGGTTPYTFSVSAGILPDGLSLNGSTGAITGTPKADAQSETFTIKVVDSTSPTPQTATQSLTIFIPLTIETTSLPSGTVSVAYNQTVAAGGGTQPYTWSTNPANLPPGLTLSATTGAITGTPTTTGTFNFTVNVVDSTPAPAGPLNASQSLSIIITTLSVTSTQPPTHATIGSPYSFNETASGGTAPYTYSLASGSFPAGLNFAATSNSTGTITISGTPTSAAVDQTFSIKVTDSSLPTPQTATTSSLTLVVNLAVTTGSLANGTVGTPYSQTITAEGGQPPYAFAVDPSGSALPSPLTLGSSSGVISGTPSAPSTTSNIIIDVTDSAGSPQTTKPTYTLTINAAVVDPCATAGTGGESLLSGSYAFVLKGFDNGSPQQPALVGGVLTFNGSGGVTAGEIDMNLNGSAGIQTSAVTGGTYKIGTSGSADQQRACMDLTTAGGTLHYRASLNSTGSLGHMIDFDASGPFTSGTLKKQDTTAFSTTKVTGNYAFGVSAPQNTANGGGKFGVVGQFKFSSGSVTGGQVDFNNNGNLNNGSTGLSFPSPVSINSGGSYTISGTTGVGTLSFTPSVSPNAVTAKIYVVSATDVFVLGSDDQTKNNDFAGEAIQQSGSLTPSGTYVGGVSRVGSTAGDSRTGILRVNLSGGNITSIAIYQNDSGTTKVTNANNAGTYTIDSTPGRLLLVSASPGDHNPVLYLVSANEAFQLGSDPGVESGFFQSQTSTAAPNSIYAFGPINPETSNVNIQDSLAAFSSGNVNLTNDNNTLSNPQQTGKTNSATISVDGTGFGESPSGCTPSLQGSCQFVFYVISTTGVVGTDFGSTTPAVQQFDH